MLQYFQRTNSFGEISVGSTLIIYYIPIWINLIDWILLFRNIRGNFMINSLTDKYIWFIKSLMTGRSLSITPLYNQIIGNYKKLRLETCLVTLSCTSLDPTAVSIKTLNKIENHLIIRMIIVNHSSQRTIETAQKRKKIKTKYKINRKLRYELVPSAPNKYSHHRINWYIFVLVQHFGYFQTSISTRDQINKHKNQCNY